jgi:hypothetical protein
MDQQVRNDLAAGKRVFLDLFTVIRPICAAGRAYIGIRSISTERAIMDDFKALSIVSALANGVNPQTGEVFDVESPYQSADLIRALYIAVRALETTRTKLRPSRTRLPSNAGKPWTENEDLELLEKFDEGLSVAELARAHDRTPAGIQARLERHGRLPAQGLQWRGRNGKMLAHAGAQDGSEQ